MRICLFHPPTSWIPVSVCVTWDKGSLSDTELCHLRPEAAIPQMSPCAGTAIPPLPRRVLGEAFVRSSRLKGEAAFCLRGLFLICGANLFSKREAITNPTAPATVVAALKRSLNFLDYFQLEPLGLGLEHPFVWGRVGCRAGV